MVAPALGEIRLFAGNFAPEGWAFCAGQGLSISANQALFSLIGNAYGGDGTSGFNLPDLRGRVPIHEGLGMVAGDAGGSETVSLTAPQLPGHTHTVGGAGAAATPKPQGGYWAENSGAATAPYSMTQDGSVMAAGAVSITGAGAPHENMQPFLALNFIIALEGGFTTDPSAYMGEVRAFAGAVPPFGWVPCNGTLLNLRQNTALFLLLGNTYGGNAKDETFGVPNLRDQVVVGVGQGPNLSKRDLGSTGGANSVTLVGDQIAAHSHAAACNAGNGSTYGPSGAYWATDAGGGSNYEPSGSDKMATGVFGTTGGGGAHENRQPFVALNYAIAVVGEYPPHS